MAGPDRASPIRESACAFHVTAWPERLENDDDAGADALALGISVEHQGRDDLWALFIGLGEGQRPAWTAQARCIPAGEPLLLPLEKALALARELAPEVSIMHWTAREAIEDWPSRRNRGSLAGAQRGQAPGAAARAAQLEFPGPGPPAAPGGPARNTRRGPGGRSGLRRGRAPDV
jgi:hypothetical protein